MFLPITLNAFCRSNSIWQKKRYTINISTACLADCLSPVFHCKCWEQTDNLLYTPCTSIHTSRYIVKKFLHDSRLQVSPRAAVSRLAAFFLLFLLCLCAWRACHFRSFYFCFSCAVSPVSYLFHWILCIANWNCHTNGEDERLLEYTADRSEL